MWWPWAGWEKASWTCPGRAPARGLHALIELIGRLEPDPAEVRVVVETSHGLLVKRLLRDAHVPAATAAVADGERPVQGDQGGTRRLRPGRYDEAVHVANRRRSEPRLGVPDNAAA